MKKARVGIITRTKDRAILLERAINSVLSQSYADWFMVIINDGGEREPISRLLQKYNIAFKDRVEVVHNDFSMGMEAASNIGVKAVDSEFILIHDDDDSLEKTFLEDTVQFLDSSLGQKFGGVATKVNRVLEEINNGSINIIGIDDWDKDLQTISLAEMAVVNRIIPISFLYRREIHELIGYYNEKLPVIGDWEFYLRFLTKKDIFVLNKNLANYHLRISSKSGVFSNTVIAGKEQHLLYDTLVRNELLRQDIENGRCGLGYLVNLPKFYNGMIASNSEQDLVRKNILRQLKNNQIDEIVMYGTGGFAKSLLPLLHKNNIKVRLFVDSNEALWGTYIESIKIVSIKEAADRNYNTFVVGSFSFIDSIIDKIHNEFNKRKEKAYIISG